MLLECLMLIRKARDIASSEITPESIYRQRRQFLKGLAAGGALLMSGTAAAVSRYALDDDAVRYPGPDWLQQKLRAATRSTELSTGEKLTPYEHVSSYNNFYEFGLGKGDPKAHAQSLQTDPWSVEISGEVHASNPPATPAMWRLPPCMIPSRCVASVPALAPSIGPMWKGCAWMRRCIR
jgi:hypothetical protein